MILELKKSNLVARVSLVEVLAILAKAASEGLDQWEFGQLMARLDLTSKEKISLEEDLGGLAEVRLTLKSKDIMFTLTDGANAVKVR
jgi:hypothetical protein